MGLFPANLLLVNGPPFLPHLRVFPNSSIAYSESPKSLDASGPYFLSPFVACHTINLKPRSHPVTMFTQYPDDTKVKYV